MIDFYSIWFDHTVSLYCVQNLYVCDGKIDEVGETITANKQELEQLLTSLAKQGTLKVEIIE
jgi:hypothetical protein